MARRKRVEAPSAQELQALEEGFAAKPSAATRPPIAQVAADAAGFAQPVSSEDRADAERYRAAEADGRVTLDLPASQIKIDQLTRDRAVLDANAMAELKASIAEHGQRHPIDIIRLEEGGYGLLSGYRRLNAMIELHGAEAIVRVTVRAPTDLPQTYVAMVEENEIRANLTHYERGRIAVLAAGQGIFPNTTMAIQTLFAAGSKGKRSKIGSFAMIHEELGDLLAFPEALSERAGLRVASALREGRGGHLREALGRASPGDAAEEWRIISGALDEVGKPGKSGQKRRKRRADPLDRQQLGTPWMLANGVAMTSERDQHGHLIRLDGPEVDAEFAETVLRAVHAILSEE